MPGPENIVKYSTPNGPHTKRTIFWYTIRHLKSNTNRHTPFWLTHDRCPKLTLGRPVIHHTQGPDVLCSCGRLFTHQEGTHSEPFQKYCGLFPAAGNTPFGRRFEFKKRPQETINRHSLQPANWHTRPQRADALRKKRRGARRQHKAGNPGPHKQHRPRDHAVRIQYPSQNGKKTTFVFFLNDRSKLAV